jgi:hypothetical protein
MIRQISYMKEVTLFTELLLDSTQIYLLVFHFPFIWIHKLLICKYHFPAPEISESEAYGQNFEALYSFSEGPIDLFVENGY